MSADRPIVRAFVPERAGTRHSPHLSHPRYTPILRHESAERASVCAREGRRSNDHVCVRGSVVKRERNRNLSKTTHLQVPKLRPAAGSSKSASQLPICYVSRPVDRRRESTRPEQQRRLGSGRGSARASIRFSIGLQAFRARGV